MILRIINKNLYKKKILKMKMIRIIRLNKTKQFLIIQRTTIMKIILNQKEKTLKNTKKLPSSQNSQK